MGDISIFLGTVIASAPELGFAVVVDVTKTANAIGNSVIAFIPASEGVMGASEKWAPVPGEAVICMQDPTTSNRAYILDHANTANKDVSEGNGSRRYYNIDKFTATDSKAQLAELTELTKDIKQWLGNRGNRTDRDQLPGDYVVGDNQGLAGLLIGRFLSQLRGSPLSYIELSGVENKVTVVGDTIQQHTYAIECVSDADFMINNVAISLSEALGFKYGTAALEEDDDKNLTIKDKKALPLFRLQEISGGFADGRERIVTGFPDEEDVHTPETEPPVLSRHRESLSGALSDASVLGIASIKSPWIPSLQQKGYKKDVQEQYKDDEQESPELRRPYTGEAGEESDDPRRTASEDARTLDEPLNKLLDVILSDDYLDMLIQRLGDKGLMLASKDKSLIHKISDDDKPYVPGGPTNQQQYGLPNNPVTITDPVTGRSQKCYGTTSFISQEPNGDILLADGYGSEIRMSRGNIYISPALDLVMRPGRDFTSMAGRYATVNSQDTITINTSKSLYMRANEDLKIAGAMLEDEERNSGQYVVTIESGSKANGPGGMVIKSNSNLSMTGQELYIGRNAHTGKDENKTTEPASGGGIVIDAGERGILYTNSLEAVHKSKIHTVLSKSGDNASALVVGPNYIGEYTQMVLCPATVLMQPLEEGMTVSLPSGKETESVDIGTASKCHILAYGSVMINESVKINGSCVVCNNLAAKKIGSTMPMNGYIPPESSTWEPYEFEPRSGIETGTMLAPIVSQSLSQKLYSDYYISIHSFYFPSYNIGYRPKMPGMLWQIWADRKDINQEGDKEQRVWKEQYIKDPDGQDTAVYPGHDAWENGEVTKSGYEVNPLKSGYVINVKQ